MRPSLSRRAPAQRGAAIVEFALVVPLFFLIIFGLVEIAIVFAGYCSASYAAQLAVRYATVRGGDNTVTTPCTAANITALVAPYLWAAQKNSSTVTTTWSPDNYTGSTITVTIQLTYKTGIPFSTLNTIQVATSSQGTILY